MIEVIKRLYVLGKTDAEVCAIVGISKPTLYSWQKNDKELFNSIKESKGLADSMVEASLFARATGYTHESEQIFCSFGKVTKVKTLKHYAPDVLAQIFWLKNRQPEKWRDKPQDPQEPIDTQKIVRQSKKTFSEFCEQAKYPKPFAKQDEMRAFGMDETDPRILLGARGVGKTDYITALGTAYKIYCDWYDNQTPSYSNFIITKSKERNTAILNEIAKALIANGVPLEKENASEVRVEGLHGKDASASTATIKSASFRGRHPTQVTMDDPVTEDDTSEATRKLVKKKYEEAIKLTSNILIIGQPAHEHDLYAELRGLLKKMEVPHGMIPELDHDLEAQRLAGVSERSIQASYHLKIVSDGSNPFDGIKYLDKYPIARSVAFIDPSHEGGDYTAISIVRQHLEGIAVVGFVFKKAWHHCLEDIAPILTKYKVERLGFETNGLGEQPIDLLRQTFKGIGIVGRRSNNNKHSRIMALGAFSKVIHLSRDSHKAYIDQVVQYEYNAKHDDAPDSLATCLEWIGLIRGKL